MDIYLFHLSQGIAALRGGSQLPTGVVMRKSKQGSYVFGRYGALSGQRVRLSGGKFHQSRVSQGFGSFLGQGPQGSYLG